MNASVEARNRPAEYPRLRLADEVGTVPSSAVSWSAIFAGAAAAAALSLILLLLGTGLGLSAASPWANDSVSATTFGVSAILWVTLTQLLASGMGGYLAGRLRTKWIAVPGDEVYFRDTAHGFLAWAIATLTTAALLTSVIGSIVSGGVQAGASIGGAAASTVVAGAAGGATSADSDMNSPGEDVGPIGYFVDSLFRRSSDTPAPAAAGPVAEPPEPGAAALPEVTRIFVNSISVDALPPEDVRYLGQLVAQRTDITQQAAEQRVREAFTRLQSTLREAEAVALETADAAREASAYAALWLFISLLIGAFIASLAATFGGRQRDL
jgi:hypothetical protein